MSDDNIFGVSYDVNEPQKMYVENPMSGNIILDNTPDKVKSFVSMLGPDSDVQRSLDMKQSNEKISKTFKAQRKGRDLDTAFTAEKSYEDDTEELVKVIDNWYLVDFNGNPIDLECNETNIRRLMSNPQYGWLRDDCNSFRSATKNFMNTGGKTSENT